MRAAFVLRVARTKVAAVIADKRQDRVVFNSQVSKFTPNRAHGLINRSAASVVVRQLSLPIAGEKLQVCGDKGIRIAVSVSVGRHEAITIVLKVRLDLGDDQQKWLMGGAAQEI